MLLVLAGPAVAQEEHESGHDGHHDHANHLGVFIGQTRQAKDDKLLGFTLGLDYERKLNKKLGIVGRADFVTGDHKRTSLFNAAVGWHPFSGFRIAAGPGFEIVEKDKSDGTTTKSTYFLLAVGAEYSFHAGDWSIAPTIWIDFVGETKTNVAYGVTLGRGF